MVLPLDRETLSVLVLALIVLVMLLSALVVSQGRAIARKQALLTDMTHVVLTQERERRS